MRYSRLERPSHERRRLHEPGDGLLQRQARSLGTRHRAHSPGAAGWDLGQEALGSYHLSSEQFG